MKDGYRSRETISEIYSSKNNKIADKALIAAWDAYTPAARLEMSNKVCCVHLEQDDTVSHVYHGFSVTVNGEHCLPDQSDLREMIEASQEAGIEPELSLIVYPEYAGLNPKSSMPVKLPLKLESGLKLIVYFGKFYGCHVIIVCLV